MDPEEFRRHGHGSMDRHAGNRDRLPALAAAAADSLGYGGTHHGRTDAAMILYGRRAQALAWLLAAVAGYVDATGFALIGGYFVSFMSGNSTRLGIDAAAGSGGAGLAGALIGAFLAGVIAGALVAQAVRVRRASAVLMLTALLLAGAAALAEAAAPSLLIACAMAAAMGAINNVFERNGEVSIGLTYMTGSLVKLGQRIATACTGRDRLGWLPYLGLWLGFVAGVAAAAVGYPLVGLRALWGASLLLAVLAILTGFAAPGAESDRPRKPS